MSLNDDINRAEAKRDADRSAAAEALRGQSERHTRAQQEMGELLREAAQHLRKDAPRVKVVGRMKSYGKSSIDTWNYEPPVVGSDAYRRAVGYLLPVPNEAHYAVVTDEGELFRIQGGSSPNGVYQYMPAQWVETLEKPTALQTTVDWLRSGPPTRRFRRKHQLAVERQMRSNGEHIGRAGVGVGDLFSVSASKVEYTTFAELTMSDSRLWALSAGSGPVGGWRFGLAGSEPHLVMFGYESNHVGPSVREWLSEAIVDGRATEYTFPIAHW